MPSSFFWTSLSVTSIFTSLLAFAIFHLEGVNGCSPLRDLSLWALGLLYSSWCQMKTWFRPKGWFIDREIAIVVNRILHDDPFKDNMRNSASHYASKTVACIDDYNLWPIYCIGLLAYVPQSPPGTYLTLTLHAVGLNLSRICSRSHRPLPILSISCW